jgi:predicted nucleic-acid-binding protein
LDTNVLVRYLIKDDPAQGRKAAEIIKSSSEKRELCYINHIVFCELYWVLETAYKLPKNTILEIVEKILVTSDFEIEDKQTVWQALEDSRDQIAGFDDCLIGKRNAERGCRYTVSFDRGLKKTTYFTVEG